MPKITVTYTSKIELCIAYEPTRQSERMMGRRIFLGTLRVLANIFALDMPIINVRIEAIKNPAKIV